MNSVTLNPVLRFIFLCCLVFTTSVHPAHAVPDKVQSLSIAFDTIPQVCADFEGNCSAFVSYDFELSTDCTPDGLSIQVFLDLDNAGAPVPVPEALTGDFPNFTLSGDYPIGDHNFEIIVVNACADTATAILPFSVADCSLDEPVICLNGIAVLLEPGDSDKDSLSYGNGEAMIYASDFVHEPITADCSLPIKYAINKVGEPVDPDQDYLQLNCEDVGMVVLQVWAFDAAGNSSVCETYILVLDNNYLCTEGAFTLQGLIATEEGDPLAFNALELQGFEDDLGYTDALGYFDFLAFAQSDTATVAPLSPADYTNGVSVSDVIIVADHLAGVNPLPGPYKRIAADVNGSGSISVSDLISMQKIFLGISDSLSNASSWRYIPAAYTFPDPSNPWFEPLPESIQLTAPFPTLFTDLNFVAIKLGDVNGTAVTD